MHPISKRAKVVSDGKPAYTEKERSDSGGTIYRYSPSHIDARWKDKVSKIKLLEKNIGKLRKQYEKDLSSDDLRTQAEAAVVGIMDDTCARIGNEESVKEYKTYGVTTFKVKHLTFSGSKTTFKFVGKDQVKQDTFTTNSKITKVLKELVKGKKDNDFVFEIDGTKIWDRAINRYLKQFDISAKDLRGFQANRLMKDMLKKKDWQEALEEVADIVGHEATTLKNQYLDPALVEKHETKKKAEETRPLSKRATRNYWQDPDGNMVEVEGHASFVKEHPEIFGMLPEGQDSYHKLALEKGWTRLVLDSEQLSKRAIDQDHQDMLNLILVTAKRYNGAVKFRYHQSAIKGSFDLSYNIVFDSLNDTESFILEAYDFLPSPWVPKKPYKRNDKYEVCMDFTLRMTSHDIAVYEQQVKYAGGSRQPLSKRALLSQPDATLLEGVGPNASMLNGPSVLPNQTPIGPKATPPAPAKTQPAPSVAPNQQIRIWPGVKTNQLLLDAWSTLLPFLPQSAVMTSGIRTPNDQKRILRNYWQKAGFTSQDEGWGDYFMMSKILIENDWIVGPPATNAQYAHLHNNAIDIAGADLDEIAAAIELVNENPELGVKFTAPLVERKNNDVHVGIMNAKYDPNAIAKVLQELRINENRVASKSTSMSKLSAEDQEFIAYAVNTYGKGISKRAETFDIPKEKSGISPEAINNLKGLTDDFNTTDSVISGGAKISDKPYVTLEWYLVDNSDRATRSAERYMASIYVSYKTPFGFQQSKLVYSCSDLDAEKLSMDLRKELEDPKLTDEIMAVVVKSMEVEKAKEEHIKSLNSDKRLLSKRADEIQIDIGPDEQKVFDLLKEVKAHYGLNKVKLFAVGGLVRDAIIK
jgi:DNA topoisomerase-1